MSDAEEVLRREIHETKQNAQETWLHVRCSKMMDALGALKVAHAEALKAARAEGFSAARKKAEARILKRCCAAMREHGHCEHQPCDYYQNALTEIRAMTDDGGES